MSDRRQWEPAGVHYVVRVAHTGRPPFPWTWELRDESGNTAPRASKRGYRCAEDAWAAGRDALMAMGRPSGPPERR